MTPNESIFMRELRQLLGKHMIRLKNVGDSYEPRWEFQGFYEEIELTIDTVAEELKHPEE